MRWIPTEKERHQGFLPRQISIEGQRLFWGSAPGVSHHTKSSELGGGTNGGSIKVSLGMIEMGTNNLVLRRVKSSTTQASHLISLPAPSISHYPIESEKAPNAWQCRWCGHWLWKWQTLRRKKIEVWRQIWRGCAYQVDGQSLSTQLSNKLRDPVNSRGKGCDLRACVKM